jgi:amino acid transporter
MSTSDGSPSSRSGLRRAAQVIIVSSVMFTFISFWRTAAVVLCDLASTAYYIGGIVEQSIGPAAPWFILAVMVFSYAVRSVYIESSALFVRGGVYRVVKEAMGGFLAKLSVSALMFDYILTGPISGVSAGQYIMGLAIEVYAKWTGIELPQETRDAWRNWGSVVIACACTVYFFRQNLLGIHESSEKALRIMQATTIMAVVMLSWCIATLLIQGPQNSVPGLPDLRPHMNFTTMEEEDPLGFIRKTGLAESLRQISGAPAYQWLSLVGFIGLFIAFGHSILAMSGEETLAQVYREVESPKLPNFKKAAFVVFVYSLVLTGGISILAVLLIPNDVRMKQYADNLIGGLAMNVYDPTGSGIPPLILNGFVVVVGFLILAGAVNTAIIGSNGVLNRVAEDGVMPDWFLRPHPRYGTTYRILYLIVGMQLFTIIASRGDVLLLGEAYAFGVVWSFVFKAAAMLVLRFTEPGHREYKVPLNIPIGNTELPLGLLLIFVILLISAIMNLLTKETATIWGVAFTAVFLSIFMISEHMHERRRRESGGAHKHIEQFNQQLAPEITAQTLALTKPYHKLVAIRSTQNLFMLEKALAETDPLTTDVVVMTAKYTPPGGETRGNHPDETHLDAYDQQLMTAVVDRAERAGKQVKPLVVPTNNPLHAVLKTARDIGAQELIIGASNKFSAEEQLDLTSLYWINLQEGTPRPLTVRILSRNRDVYFDLEGGSRIPKISERQAKTVAELRAAGVGVDRVLMAHDGSPGDCDIFQSVLTMLDLQVALDLVVVPSQNGAGTTECEAIIDKDSERSRQLGREINIHHPAGELGQEIIRLVEEGKYDLVIVPLSTEHSVEAGLAEEKWVDYVLHHAPCQVSLMLKPSIPTEVEEPPPSPK